MSKKYKKTKTNKKSSVYEDDVYRLRLSDGSYAFKRKANKMYADDDALEQTLVPFDILEVTHKITGKTSKKRVFQGENAVGEFFDDAESEKSQFESIFKKIDPQN